MLLFYFDHNVSALMAQARQYPVKKPAGFHWDFCTCIRKVSIVVVLRLVLLTVLLGITTLVSGFLGLPAPNGLVPQAPVNSEALSVMSRINVEAEDSEGVVAYEDYEQWKKRTKESRRKVEHKVVRTAVIEQRVSHLAIGVGLIACDLPAFYADHFLASHARYHDKAAPGRSWDNAACAICRNIPSRGLGFD